MFFPVRPCICCWCAHRYAMGLFDRKELNIVKTKYISPIIRTVLLVSLLCLVQMPEITQVITPTTVAAQGEHIEILSYSLGCGLVPDQTLRVTVLDPNELQPRNEQTEPSRARVRLLLSDGSVIRQSPEFLVPLGGFNFVDFRRADLPVPGDVLTGRVQVLAQVILFVREHQRLSGLSPVSGEIISAITGQT